MLATDERLGIKVGAIALCLLAAAIAFVVFLLDRIELRTPVRIAVYFRHSAGLRERASLVVAGRAVGYIESIEPVPHADHTPLDGESGVVARVAVDPRWVWAVPADADIFVASHGALSEKYLEIAPPRVRGAAPHAPVHEGAMFRGADPPSLDNVLQHTWTNMLIYRAFADAVKPQLAELKTQLAAMQVNLDAALIGKVGPLIDDARAIEVAAGDTRAALDLDRAPSTIRSARQVVAQARAAIDRLDPALAALAANTAAARDRTAPSIEAGRAALAKIRAALDRIDPLLAQGEALADLVARGEGSLGRLMKDPEFPEDAKAVGKVLKRHPWRIVLHPL